MSCSQNPQCTDYGASTDMSPIALDAHKPRELPFHGVSPLRELLASPLEGLVRWSEATFWEQNETYCSHTAVALPVLQN